MAAYSSYYTPMAQSAMNPIGYAGFVGQHAYNACRGCTTSGMRCSKQKPHCRRCRQLGLDCDYSTAPRKESRSSYVAGNNLKNFDSNKRQRLDMAFQNESDSKMQFYLDSEPAFLQTHTGPMISENDDFLLHEFLDESLWQTGAGSYSPVPQPSLPAMPSMSPSTNFDSGSERSQSPLFDSLSEGPSEEYDDNFSPITTPENNTDSMAAWLSENIENVIPTSVPAYSSAPIGPMGADHPCMTKASRTLEDIYKLKAVHEKAKILPSGNKASSDQILTASIQAVATFEHILAQQQSCPLCSQDFRLPFLLATIGSNLVGWYQTVYRDELVEPSGGNNGHKRSASSSSSVSSPAAAKGIFKLDKEVESRVKAQLFRRELRKLGGTFEKFGRKTKVEGHQFVGARQWGMFACFEQFLLPSVEELIAKLDRFCCCEA
ncbi:hypothetical protein M501DRAFT_1058548 [Patellaria atrata CBS 101060]|uniref:Zn(2)-C6 fungal-type domain-containing protein n=1 Tax=Patellaria atrata CBS 101060 TaxID=1346257 RepID=A0A9P4VMA4_9PEZI|nr:hypothetical protein M501DRAFT_1058548 [Patellaria atrata CBS 101060]